MYSRYNNHHILQADADKLIAIADQNGDGVIDYAEFVEMQNMSTVLI